MTDYDNWWNNGPTVLEELAFVVCCHGTSLAKCSKQPRPGAFLTGRSVVASFLSEQNHPFIELKGFRASVAMRLCLILKLCATLSLLCMQIHLQAPSSMVTLNEFFNERAEKLTVQSSQSTTRLLLHRRHCPMNCRRRH